MEIRIIQKGEQLGPFSELQVRKYLGEGLVAPSDLALCEGMNDWQSLDLVLANLPPSDPNPEMTSSETTQIESSLPIEQEPDPGPQLTIDDSAPVTADTPPPPIPAPDPIQSLTATQKTKRNKIVLQPILPLEPTGTALSARKRKTGKTALTLEPLRPTTALPPVSGFAPREGAASKEKKTGKTQLRTGQLTFGGFADKPAPEARPKPALPPVLPATTAVEPPPPSLPARTAMPYEYTSRSSYLKPWYRRIPREMLLTGGTLALIIVCVLAAFAYFVLAHHATLPAPSLMTPAGGTSPPGHAEIQSPPSSGSRTASDYNDRGLTKQNQGDLDGAIQDYTQALSLDSKDVVALCRRGLARQAKGDTNGAMDDYDQALQIDPKQADAYSNRAFIKQGKGDIDGALVDYAEALQINPKNPRAFYNEGLIEVQKGHLDEAISDYDHTLDLDPKMAFAYYNRGVAKNMEGNLDGAIADYTQAVALNPKIARAYSARGVARQTKGDNDGALADYSQALSLNPQLADALYNRGLIKMQQGDLDGAIADNTEAINSDPKNAGAYSNRGLALFGKGKLDDATADLKKFCELVPTNTNVDSARLYLWLISTQQNPKGNADQVLSTSLLNEWNSPPEDLTSKIAAFLVGHMKEGDLIANAASPDPSREPAQYCKVWYFAGMKRLLAGDMKTAIGYFQKSLNTEQKSLCEYVFSQAELKALGQNRAMDSKSAGASLSNLSQ